MTRAEILELWESDPQKLVDDRVVVRFNEVEGDARLVDAVAAGGSWAVFEFDTGKYAGRSVALVDEHYPGDEPSFRYIANACDDGMLFNSGLADEGPLDDEAEPWGGDHVPELDGMVLTVKWGK